MRKSKTLIALIAVLVVLVGSYVYMSSKPKEDSKADTDKQEIELSKLDENKITKMTLNSESGTLAFERKDDVWDIISNPGIKLDQTAVNSLASSFANLNAQQLVAEDTNELENYGLKQPVVTASVVEEEGGEKVFYLGNKAPGGTAYYLMPKDDQKVYTISSEDGDRFSYTLTDVRDKRVSNLNRDEINYASMVRQGEKTIELRKSLKGSQQEIELGPDTWAITNPYGSAYPVEGFTAEGMLDAIAGMSIAEFVDDNPSDYAKYGLDKPVMELTAKDGSSTERLLFGKDQDESRIYFMVDGSKGVYSMDKSKLQAFDIKPFDVVSKGLRVAYSSNVDQLILEAFGRKDVYTVTRAVKPASKPDEEETVESTFKLNGKEIDEGDFYLTFNTIMGLRSEAENDRKVEDKPEVKVTLILNKGGKRQTELSFIPYNEDFYTIFKDGSGDFLISRQQLKGAIDEIHKIADKYK